MSTGAVVIVGGTSGIGLRLAERYAAHERDVVITGRDAERAAACARGVGDRVAACALDLAEPHGLAGRLAGIGAVDHLVLAAIERDEIDGGWLLQ